jgi:hypothetical protein
MMPKIENDSSQAEALEVEANAIASWLHREFLPEPLPELLDDAEKSRQADKWREAADKYQLFLAQTQALNRIDGRIGTYEALAYAYLGIVYYAQNDFIAATEFFKQADKAFADALYRRNQAVVAAARGLIHLRREEKVLANTCYQQALGILGESDVQAKVKEQWTKTNKLLEDAREEAARARAVQVPPSSSGKKATRKHRIVDHEGNMVFDKQRTDSEPVRTSTALKWLFGIAVVIAMGGLIVVGGLGGWVGAIAYGITFTVATMGYVIASFTQTPCNIPSLCAAIIEGVGDPKVVPGPARYYKWLFIQNVRAIVPLHRFQYISSKQTVSLKGETSADVSLAVRFGVGHLVQDNAIDKAAHEPGNEETDKDPTAPTDNGAHADPSDQHQKDGSKNKNDAGAMDLPFHYQISDQDVLRSVYAIRDMEAKGGAGDRKTKILMPGALRPLWQKKLGDDAKMTLYAVLSGKYGSKELDSEIEKIEVALTQDLNARTHDWGICVQEVRIAELVRPRK